MFVSLYDEDINRTPKNIFFQDIHQEFLQNGWRLRETTMTNMLYYNSKIITDEFKIRFENKLIYITIPITYGNYEYTTKFTSFFLAIEYITYHLKNYRNKLSIV